ncbi:MAG: prenyltransferase [Deltaproteobacteria bacterium]|nr:prenyltransferase [Deltaproteobacteria bacterium]
MGWQGAHPFLWSRFTLCLFSFLFLHGGFVFQNSLEPSPTSERKGTPWMRPFTGGKGFIQHGTSSRKEPHRLVLGCFGISILLSLGLIAIGGWNFLWIYSASYILAYGYRTPPFQWAYRGLGELAIALLYGFLVTLAGYSTQTHFLSGEILWVGFSLTLFAIAVQCLNEFPDAEFDQAMGKRQGVVQLGKARAARLFRWFFWIAYNWIALGVLAKIITPWALLTFLTVPSSFKAIQGVQNHFFDTPQLAPFNNQVVRIYFTTALLFTISYLIESF